MTTRDDDSSTWPPLRLLVTGGRPLDELPPFVLEALESLERIDALLSGRGWVLLDADELDIYGVGWEWPPSRVEGHRKMMTTLDREFSPETNLHLPLVVGDLITPRHGPFHLALAGDGVLATDVRHLPLAELEDRLPEIEAHRFQP